MTFPRKIVCILGMHRSGTSCLTGSLEEAGLFLADRHTWNPYNTKGNRENQKFVDLHDAILAAGHGAWNDPPRKVVWSASHLQQARDLLGGYSQHSIFGFKDPRALLLLDGWKQVYPGLQFVGIFRHPNAVASSLANRDGMPRGQALDLWYRYNQMLYNEHVISNFPLLCFDDEQHIFQEKLDHVVKNLGLNDKNQSRSFYDEQLRTSGVNIQQALPWKVHRLYKKLAKRAF